MPLPLIPGCAKTDKVEGHKLEIKLTKLHTINGYPIDADSSRTFKLSYSTNLDKNGNIFILDEQSGSIKVFDSKGKYVLNISRRGLGPEELEDLDFFYLDNDTVIVIDNRKKMKKFLNTGNFISQSILNFEKPILNLSCKVLNDSLMLVSRNTYDKTEDDVIVNSQALITDRLFNEKKVLYSSTVNINEMYLLYLESPESTADKKSIYISKRSKKEYKIDIYDHLGNKSGNIRKNYLREKFSEDEVNSMSDHIRNFPAYNQLYDYKVSIHALESDKFGNLWVMRETGYFGQNHEYDIFKDDKLISECVFENTTGKSAEKSIILGKYLYLLDFDNNLIDIYDYKFE